MTVKLVTTVQKFIGVSTDAKPADAPVGSTFYELNTGEAFIFDGSNWVEDLALIYALSQALP